MSTHAEIVEEAKHCLKFGKLVDHYVARHLVERVEQLEAEKVQMMQRIGDLELSLRESEECIEDVCCGATLECVKCGKPRPCLCMDAGAKQ